MKRLIIISLLICFGTMTVRAQEAYKSGAMFIIECEGMPADSYTKTPKPRTTNGTATTMGTNTAANLGSIINNEKVAYKFEVAAADNAPELSWLEAVNLCAGLSGGNWRLPTQRELILLWVMEGKLQTLPGFTKFSPDNRINPHWSASESAATKSFNSLFSVGTMLDNTKTFPYKVRCVRDM